jgi:predicted transcriptional regulator
MTNVLLSEYINRDVEVLDHEDSLRDLLKIMVEKKHFNVIINKEESVFIVTAQHIINAYVHKHSLDAPISTLSLKKTLLYTESSLLQNLYHHDFTHCDYICITDDDGAIFGILSASDLHSLIDPSQMMKNRQIGHFIFRKLPKSLDVTVNVEFAFQMICERSDDAIIVVDDERAVGIFSTQDALRLLLNGYDNDRPIGTYMTTPIHLFNQKSSVYEGLEFLSFHNHKRLVVVDDDETLLGLVSKRELVSFFQLG